MIPLGPLLAQSLGTLDVLDTTTVNGRATQPAQIVAVGATERTAPLGLDLMTAPSGHLHLSGQSLELDASYTPTLTLRDVELGGIPLLIQGLTARASWHDRLVRVTVSEIGTYGQLNSGLLYQPVALPDQPPQVQSAPAASTIDFGATTTEASVVVRLEPRDTLSATGGFSASGGLNASSQAVLPDQTNAHGTLSTAYQPSRQDVATTSANGQAIETRGGCPPGLGSAPGAFCVVTAQIEQLVETLAHRLSRSATLTVGAGAALTQTAAPGRSTTNVAPVVSLSLEQTLGPLGRLTAAAQLAPFADIRTGLVIDRLSANLALSQPLSDHVSLVVSASALRSTPLGALEESATLADPYPLTALSADAAVVVSPDPAVDLRVGVRELWQEQTGYGDLQSAIAFVGVVARVPTVRF